MRMEMIAINEFGQKINICNSIMDEKTFMS
jgi:hypothetical protein